MKTFSLPDDGQDLRELLDLASEENVVLTTPDGRRFVIAEIDDFDSEIKLVREHHELMEFLCRRSATSSTLSLDEARKQLGLASQ